MIVRRAQVVLAATFAAVLLALLGVFAGSVYVYAASTFDFDVVGGERVAADAAEQGLAALRHGIVISLAVLVVVVPAVSYLLAGLALRPVREAYAREQRLSDDAAHELRTPLSVLRAVLELALARDRPGGEYRAAIGTSLDVVTGLERLTQELLALARAGDRQVRRDFRSTDGQQVVYDAVERTVVDGSGGVRLVVHAPPVAFVGAHDLVVAGVANLLSNAVAAAHERGHVRVEVDARAGCVQFVVTDDGVGMSADELARATERFWSTSTRTDAHGIGLALVEQVARLHGGTLTLRSTVGRGTTATLALPIDTHRHRHVIDRLLAWSHARTGHSRRS